MKVFLSWSGYKSQEVAKALKEWLPSVIQSISPYVSSEDIKKGSRWSIDLAKELEDTCFGVLCVTKENMEAPWLLFEAGALSKMIDTSSVCPFLFDLKRTEVKEGPILLFQSTVFEKEDIRQLIETLNNKCGESKLDNDLLTKTFDIWWPKLKERLDKIKEIKDIESKSINTKPNNNDMLEEILELSRTNQKLLRSPDILFPREYLDTILDKGNNHNIERRLFLFNRLRNISMELKDNIMQANNMIEFYKAKNKVVDEELCTNVRNLIDLSQHLYANIMQSNFTTR